MNFKTGNNKNYYWIETHSNKFDLNQLRKEIPEILIRKYLAIICFDGGQLKPSKKEINSGWYEKENITYSPILSKKELNNPISEDYDQWCLFNEKTEIEMMSDFVNYESFTLIDKRLELEIIHPTWDKISLEKDIEKIEKSQNTFWKEIDMINPYTYISCATNFIYVTKNFNEIEKIKRFLV